jgi:hypothetical protein
MLHDSSNKAKLSPDRSLALLISSFEPIWDPRHDDFGRSLGAFTVRWQARKPQSMQSTVSD